MKRCTIKTYGRSSESASSRAFDEIMHNKNNKTLTVKASPMIQKWGKTSFTAVRGRKDRDPEANLSHERDLTVSKRPRFDDDLSDDPFSFESEDTKGTSRNSVTKVPLHSNASQKNIIVTAPAVGIVTKKSFNDYKIETSPVKPLSKTDPDKVLYRSAKTYSVSPTKRIDQFSPEGSLESAPTKMTIKVSDYSYSQKLFLSQKNTSGSTQHSNSPESSSCITLSTQSTPEKLISVLSKLPSSEENKDEDSYKFKRAPIIRTYTSHKLPVSVTPTSSPSKLSIKQSPKSSAPASPHTPNTIFRDKQDSFTNSTVISRSEVKNNRGTTIIFLCKPKGMEGIKSLKKTPRETASELFDKIIKKKPVNVCDSSEEEPPNIISAGSPVSSLASDDDGPPPLSPEDLEFDSYHHTSSAEGDVEMFDDDQSDEESIKLFSLDDKEDSSASDGKKMPCSSNTSKSNDVFDDIFKLDDDDFSFTTERCNSVSSDSKRNSVSADPFDLDDDTYDKSLTMRTAKTYTRQSAKEKPAERKIFKSKNTKYSITGSVPPKLSSKSPKKSPSKAVYNARSWVMDMDEDLGQKDEKPSSSGSTISSGGGGGSSSSSGSSSKTSLAASSKGGQNSSSTTSGTSGSTSKSGTTEESTKAAAVVPKLTRKVHWPCRIGDEAFTSLKVSKEHKELYTVVRNVKEAHEVQESGETQEFMDDVEYLLAGLGDTEPMSTRCLSAFGIASKCMMPAFRMHLRAHGTPAKIFTALHDASTNPSLALSTATLMFMLMRDRLSYDVGQDTLSLIVQLLEVETGILSNFEAKEYDRMIQKVRELYRECHKIGMAKQIDLDSISTGNLAMESLLTITASRNASDVFKNELRSLGALDHIVNTVCSCVESLNKYTLSMSHNHRRKLEKVDRCLRVLENVTITNIENQSFLISYKQCALVNSLNTALRHCQHVITAFPLEDDLDRPSDSLIDKESNGWIIFSCMLAVLRVLLNLTHENDYGSTKVGSQEGLIQTVFDCILQVPQYTIACKRFDLLVLGLGLLINLVEHCVVNRRLLVTMQTVRPSDSSSRSETLGAVEALVDLFCRKEQAAREMEAQEEEEESSGSIADSSTNKSGNWEETDSCLQWIVGTKKKHEAEKQAEDRRQNGENNEEDAEDAEEKFTKALHEAGKHMENSFVAAYVALLIGCLIQDNQSHVEKVKEHLPNGFEPMIKILKKFLEFMNLTSASGGSGSRSIARVIETLEAC